MLRKRKHVKEKEEKNTPQDVYVLNREITDVFLLLKAFTYILWFNGMVIDENTYNALPDDCKRLFVKIQQKED